MYKKFVTILGTKEDGSYRSGSIFMDAPPHASMDDLCALANDEWVDVPYNNVNVVPADGVVRHGGGAARCS